jgi:hypothetical protein
MTTPEHSGRHHGPVDSAIQQLVKDARHAGIKKFQVLALIHPGRDGAKDTVVRTARGPRTTSGALRSVPTGGISGR